MSRILYTNIHRKLVEEKKKKKEEMLINIFKNYLATENKLLCLYNSKLFSVIDLKIDT